MQRVHVIEQGRREDSNELGDDPYPGKPKQRGYRPSIEAQRQSWYSTGKIEECWYEDYSKDFRRQRILEREACRIRFLNHFWGDLRIR